MPLVRLFHNNDVFEKKLDKNTNLVVQAGIKKFPFPHLKYKCGMGACGTCECFIVSGKENISEPTWKEKKILKEKLISGSRLACQFRIFDDIDLKQF
jgi:ferredoxin